ncbi:MAG: hypothetical protein WC683_02715 [bacterium]
MSNKVTVADLKNQIGVPGPHPFLLCNVCGAENSANAGDYWDAPKDHVFTCCGEPMVLATKRTVYTEVE